MYTPLLDLQYPFDIVHDVPVDDFHLFKEGITKKIAVRIFKGTSAAAKEVTRAFDELFVRMRVFSESPRRTRSVNDVKKFKGKISEVSVRNMEGLLSLCHHS